MVYYGFFQKTIRKCFQVSNRKNENSSKEKLENKTMAKKKALSKDEKRTRLRDLFLETV